MATSGNAIVEFVYLAVLMMVPLVYILITVFRVQAASYAVSSAAREAGRVYATSETLGRRRPASVRRGQPRHERQRPGACGPSR